eukprot:6177143-Pleurochrysis_carterae.AAC.2
MSLPMRCLLPLRQARAASAQRQRAAQRSARSDNAATPCKRGRTLGRIGTASTHWSWPVQIILP